MRSTRGVQRSLPKNLVAPPLIWIPQKTRARPGSLLFPKTPLHASLAGGCRWRDAMRTTRSSCMCMAEFQNHRSKHMLPSPFYDQGEIECQGARANLCQVDDDHCAAVQPGPARRGPPCRNLRQHRRPAAVPGDHWCPCCVRAVPVLCLCCVRAAPVLCLTLTLCVAA